MNIHNTGEVPAAPTSGEDAETPQVAYGEQSDSDELAQAINDGLNRAIREQTGRAHLSITTHLSKVEMGSGSRTLTVELNAGRKYVTLTDDASGKAVEFGLRNTRDGAGNTVASIGRFRQEGYDTDNDARDALQGLSQAYLGFGSGSVTFTLDLP